MDIRQRQAQAQAMMELFQLAKENDPLQNPAEVNKMSRNRFCFLYGRSLALILIGFPLVLLTYNTESMVEALRLLLNATSTTT